MGVIDNGQPMSDAFERQNIKLAKIRVLNGERFFDFDAMGNGPTSS